MVSSTQEWEGEDLASSVIWRNRLTIPFWNLLFDALMRSGWIEVPDLGMQDTMQLLLLEDEKVIETLSTHAAQKLFTDRIGAFAWEGVVSILLPLVAATQAKQDPNVLSRSRMR